MSTAIVQSAMKEVFGVSMSLGTVNKLRLEASNAVASCVDEAKLYIQSWLLGRMKPALIKEILMVVIRANAKHGCGWLSPLWSHFLKLP